MPLVSRTKRNAGDWHRTGIHLRVKLTRYQYLLFTPGFYSGYHVEITDAGGLLCMPWYEIEYGLVKSSAKTEA